MKRHLGWALTAASALALAGAALAQNVPAKFVVSGKAAEQIQDFSTINLATAERIAEVCERLAQDEARKIGREVAVTIHVLDNDGNDVYGHRMDGQGYLNIITAEMKARTALMGREPSKNRMNRVTQDPNTEIPLIMGGFFPNSGGLPIVVNKQLIGAAGVGGSAARVNEGWSDEICLHKAMTEVLGPQPPLVQDLPPRRNPPPANPAPVPNFNLPQGVIPKTSLPAEWVVSGAAARNIFDANQISGAAAKRVARVCRDWAASKGGSASIYIIDTAGTLVHMERMDGQVFNNIRTAKLKAETALKTRQPTSIRAAQLRNDPGGLPRSAVWYNFFAVSGGMPIVVDGEMIGAIGVGGGAGGGDEACAMEGLKAVFGNRVALPAYPAAAARPG
jgi:glc operon protein GlcG